MPRLVVIEDEPGIVDFLARGLAVHGFDVVCATDGLDGEKRALAHGVDLVVLDRVLPGRDGLEVLKGIRQRRPALPVVVISACAEAEDRAMMLEAGAAAFVAKPFSIADLVACIRLQLRDERGRGMS